MVENDQEPVSDGHGFRGLPGGPSFRGLRMGLCQGKVGRLALNVNKNNVSSEQREEEVRHDRNKLTDMEWDGHVGT